MSIMILTYGPVQYFDANMKAIGLAIFPDEDLSLSTVISIGFIAGIGGRVLWTAMIDWLNYRKTMIIAIIVHSFFCATLYFTNISIYLFGLWVIVICQ